jgi:hypothetical protein
MDGIGRSKWMKICIHGVMSAIVNFSLSKNFHSEVAATKWANNMMYKVVAN